MRKGEQKSHSCLRIGHILKILKVQKVKNVGKVQNIKKVKNGRNVKNCSDPRLRPVRGDVLRTVLHCFHLEAESGEKHSFNTFCTFSQEQA